MLPPPWLETTIHEPYLVPTIVTSTHAADFRVGHWETLQAAWPGGGFGALTIDAAIEVRAQLLDSLHHVTLPREPTPSTAGAWLAYQVAVFREHIIQGALYFTAQVVAAAESGGYVVSPNTARGQWVRFVLHALCAASRERAPILPTDEGQLIESCLVDDTLRRIAHELPDRHAIPAAIADTYRHLCLDYAETKANYARFPMKWVNETTPAACWFIGKASADQLLADGPESTNPADHELVSRSVLEAADTFIEWLTLVPEWTRIAEVVTSMASPAAPALVFPADMA